MKKAFYIIGIIIVLAICYIFVNFFLFDTQVCHSSEKQINEYVQKKETKKLNNITKDNKTYHFLKEQDTISIERKSDNQGSGHIGYYNVDINGKTATLTIKIKHAFLPESPEVKTIKLNQ